MQESSDVLNILNEEQLKLKTEINSNPDLVVTEKTYRVSPDQSNQLGNIFRSCCPDSANAISNRIKKHGWVVVDLGETFFGPPLEKDLTSATAICALLGYPIQPYQRRNLWKPLGVNLDVGPGKASAPDFIPLHIDLVNTTKPPAFSCLLTVRVDPLGGGNSLVADFSKALDQLDNEDIEALKQKSFADGQFYDMENVGDEYNPFPIISDHDDFIRFTAKWDREKSTSENNQARINLNDQLLKNSKKHLLANNELIILDQRRVAHGRETLSAGQENVPEEKRRFVLQSFVSDAH